MGTSFKWYWGVAEEEDSMPVPREEEEEGEDSGITSRDLGGVAFGGLVPFIGAVQRSGAVAPCPAGGGCV